MLCVCVSIGAWAINIQGNGGTYEVSDGVATFNVTNPGAIAQHWTNNIVGNLPDGTRIVFTPGSKINEADLTTILTSGTDQKRFYIDLFDIVGDGGPTLTQIDGWITNGVTEMASSWKSQYGLILPYNSSLGTMAVEKPNGNEWSNVATFTQYVAYYRDTNDTNNLVLHIFDSYYHQQNTSTYVYSGDAPKGYYSTAAQHLNTHTQIQAAHSVLVSTITNIQFDLSKFEASKVKIEITHDDVIGGHKNPAIPDKANIYVNSEIQGGFNEHVSTTGTKDTPTDILKISGPVSQTDVKAVKDFTKGPRVLDLRNANVSGGITKALLESITNDNIEYILLPEGMSKDIVCGANYQLANLKAVISSSSTNLVAHVAQAGSLPEARTLATGGAYGTIYPAVVGLTSVTLSGNLNAADIKANSSEHGIGTDGHWKSSGDEIATGLAGEQNTITSIDLRNAVFKTIDDMNLSYAGLTSLTSVQLPIASSMDRLPENCLQNIETLQSLCIPSNYKEIGKNALHLCGALTIITDNDAHTAYIGKDGESFLTEQEALTASYNTYTLSKNITRIETGAFQTRSTSLSDIYVLATTTPVCEVDAFAKGMNVGWEGFAPDADKPYCREKYINNGIYFTVLHYPSDNGNIANYAQMEKNYTDVTKIFTKKEQTGAVDGNGRHILWPTLSEIWRVYAQATNGKTWHDWETAYNGQQAVNYTENYDETYTKSAVSGGETYDFDYYIGWHQFVLTMATTFDPPVVPVNNQIITEYEDAGWFTFCIPFDMTFGEVLQLMGVPKSEGNYINKLNGYEQTQDVFPDIRQLRSVQRIQGDATHNNKVIFRLTTNLYRNGEPKYLTFTYNSDNDNVKTQIAETGTVPADGTHTGYDQRLLMGGRPYIIKAYKIKGEKIPQNNLGQYVMNRYGNKFSEIASCINEYCYEQLGTGSSTTLQFAKPYENHKIQAASDADTSSENWQTTGGWLEYDDNGTKRPYYYTLVGQFWEQPLPRYCFYMSKGKWYRNSTVNNYVWSPYKCVIMATPYQADNYGWNESGKKSGKYRDASRSHYPTISGTDLLDSELKIGFLDGRNDDDFPKPNGAKYSFAFDDDIMEIGDEIDVTSIDCLDGESVEATIPTNGKVYNMAGQYVGSSLEGLGKGLYIVNGKKYVVK